MSHENRSVVLEVKTDGDALSLFCAVVPTLEQTVGAVTLWGLALPFKAEELAKSASGVSQDPPNCLVIMDHGVAFDWKPSSVATSSIRL